MTTYTIRSNPDGTFQASVRTPGCRGAIEYEMFERPTEAQAVEEVLSLWPDANREAVWPTHPAAFYLVKQLDGGRWYAHVRRYGHPGVETLDYATKGELVEAVLKEWPGAVERFEP